MAIAPTACGNAVGDVPGITLANVMFMPVDQAVGAFVFKPGMFKLPIPGTPVYFFACLRMNPAVMPAASVTQQPIQEMGNLCLPYFHLFLVDGEAISAGHILTTMAASFTLESIL